MIFVVKRSGKNEQFSEEKVKQTFATTSAEAGAPFSEAELNDLIGELKLMLGDRGVVTSKEIYVMALGILYSRGFDDAAKLYRGHERNSWKY